MAIKRGGEDGGEVLEKREAALRGGEEGKAGGGRARSWWVLWGWVRR